MKQQTKIIDGDGHVFEDAEAIARHFPYTIEPARVRGGVFPSQSHIQFSLTRRPPGAFGIRPDGRFQNPGPEGWIEFMDEIGFEYAVLFPTTGQRIGRLVDRDYAVGAARAYNNWLAETYLRRDRRFKGIGILPMHDADAALEELRRAYTELGMSGVLFPATGVHLNLGAKPLWPLYAEAARLGEPAACQVADRCHLLHNLADVLTQVFTAHTPELAQLTDVNLHRIIRRSTTYGAPYDPNATSEHDDELPRGIYFIFLSAKAMATIEFLQRERKSETPAVLWTVAYVTVGLIFAGMWALFAWLYAAAATARRREVSVG